MIHESAGISHDDFTPFGIDRRGILDQPRLYVSFQMAAKDCLKCTTIQAAIAAYHFAKSNILEQGSSSSVVLFLHCCNGLADSIGPVTIAIDTTMIMSLDGFNILISVFRDSLKWRQSIDSDGLNELSISCS